MCNEIRRCIFVIGSILILLLTGSCKTTKKVSIQKDEQKTEVEHRDSVNIDHQHVQQGSVMDLTRHLYDSVITKVTIIRYDTIQRIVEQIQIEQMQIQKGDEIQNVADSLIIEQEHTERVSKHDSLIWEQKVDQREERKINRGEPSFFVLLISLILTGFMAWLFIQSR